MTDGPRDTHILGTLDRDGLGNRIIRGRETAETLTCLSLAILWDDPERNHFDCPWAVSYTHLPLPTIYSV